MHRYTIWGIATAALFLSTPLAFADKTVLPTTGGRFHIPISGTPQETHPRGVIELSGGGGIIFLQSNEIVYARPGSSDHLSQLIWQSTVPVLTGAAKVRLPAGWSIKADARVATGGGYMEDYDWFGPYFKGYGFNDWTHRSQHDKTNLDWYFNGSLLIGYDAKVSDHVTITPDVGLDYTDVQWSAYGGKFVYSTAGYRDNQFTLPDSIKGITYRQQLPALVAGINAEITQDRWVFDLAAHGGVTFNASGRDQHWLRDLHFTDTMQPSPIASVGATANYRMSKGVHLFLSGTATRIFTARGDTDVSDLAGNPLGSAADVAGLDHFSASISGGLKGTF